MNRTALLTVIAFAALVATGGCATGTYMPGEAVDSSLVGKKIEIMTENEKRVVKVKQVEDGIIYTESGETFVNADIVRTDPDAP